MPVYVPSTTTNRPIFDVPIPNAWASIPQHFWGSQTATFAPAAGLRRRTMVDNDIVGWNRTCPHCGLGFDDEREVVEPPDQSFSLHVACLLVVAATYSMEIPPEVDVDPVLDKRYEDAARELGIT